MIDAIRNAIRFFGIGLDVAVTIASSAQLIDLELWERRIAMRCDTDLVVLNPELAPLGTMALGAWRMPYSVLFSGPSGKGTPWFRNIGRSSETYRRS